MRFSLSAATTLVGLSAVVSAGLVPKKPAAVARVEERALEYVVKPKVFIISMFAPEADVWYGIPEFDLNALNVTVPGFSPLFPDAHCTANGDICQLTTGESGTSWEELYTHEQNADACSQRSMLRSRSPLLFGVLALT